MTDEMRKDLSRYGWVMETLDWQGKYHWIIHPREGKPLWSTADSIVKELTAKYPGYRFSKGELHDGLKIHTVINIYKKD